MSGDLHCGDCGSTNIVGPERVATRSLPQLKRYHAMIKAALHHWPEAHARKYGIANKEDLRKWLQMRAGHREVAAHVELAGMSKEQALMIAEASIKAAGSYAVPLIHGDVLVIFRPKSIAFHKLGHTEFCLLNDEVDEAIFQVTGTRGKQMLKEMERAA